MFIDFNTNIKKTEKNEKKKKKSAVSGKGFLKALFGAESAGVEEDFEKLIDEVDKYGEELQRERNFHSFEKYKKSVKKLIDKIKEHNNVIKKTTGKNVLGGRQLYVIKSINQELEEMTTKLINNKDIHFVLNKMDDVRGMLVDIYTE